jgi:hypothetical protein
LKWVVGGPSYPTLISKSEARPVERSKIPENPPQLTKQAHAALRMTVRCVTVAASRTMTWGEGRLRAFNFDVVNKAAGRNEGVLFSSRRVFLCLSVILRCVVFQVTGIPVECTYMARTIQYSKESSCRRVLRPGATFSIADRSRSTIIGELSCCYGGAFSARAPFMARSSQTSYIPLMNSVLPPEISQPSFAWSRLLPVQPSPRGSGSSSTT